MEKTIEIPEGYEARIEGNKVILELKESEDERIRKVLIHIVKGACDMYGIKYKGDDITEEKLLAYLERQKEQKPLSTEETELNSIAFLEQMGYTCIPPRKEQKPAESRTAKFLKSLRPQPHWKPSEEQMKEYRYWYKNFVESGLASPSSKAVTVLGELLEQLKKL